MASPVLTPPEFLGVETSPSDILPHLEDHGEDDPIRWFYSKQPLGAHQMTDVVARGEFFRFCPADSRALEQAYLSQERELSRAWWAEFALFRGRGDRSIFGGKGAAAKESPSRPPSKNCANRGSGLVDDDIGERIVVKGGLHQVDLEMREMSPCYWSAAALPRVLRGSWFVERSGEWVPVEESVAEQLEGAFLGQVWNRKTEQEGGWMGARVDLVGRDGAYVEEAMGGWVGGRVDLVGRTQGGLHAYFLEADQMWLCDDTLSTKIVRAMSQVAGSSSGPPGARLRRGYDAALMWRHNESDWGVEAEEQRARHTEVTHLVLVVHGIGQRLDFVSLTTDLSALRRNLHSVNPDHFPRGHRHHRVEVLPVQWRKHLSLEADNMVEKLQPHGARALRQALHTTILDGLYYLTPRHCQDIIDSVTLEMNTIYHRFMRRNPSFKGTVSMLGHSLGSVLAYDILCNQNRTGGPSSPSCSSHPPADPSQSHWGEPITKHPMETHECVPDSLGGQEAADPAQPGGRQAAPEDAELAWLRAEVARLRSRLEVAEAHGDSGLPASSSQWQPAGAQGADRETVQPAGPGRETVQPAGPGGEMVQPAGPGGEMVQPAGPGGETVQPAMPGGEMAQPAVPGGDMVQPAVPGGKMVQPAVPGGEGWEVREDMETNRDIGLGSGAVRIGDREEGHAEDACQHSDIKQQSSGTGEDTPSGPRKRRQSNASMAGPGVKYRELDFEVETLLLMGSPLGMFIVLRGDCGWDKHSLTPSITPNVSRANLSEHISEGEHERASTHVLVRPAVKRMYNVYHPYDPVAYRLEPLISQAMCHWPAPLVPYHKGGKRWHYGMQEMGKDLSARTNLAKVAVQGSISAVQGSIAAMRQFVARIPRVAEPSSWFHPLKSSEPSRHLGEVGAMEGESETEAQATKGMSAQGGKHHTTQLDLAAQQLLCQLAGCSQQDVTSGLGTPRLDHMLQESAMESQVLSALTSHMCYWTHRDVALFTIRAIVGLPVDGHDPSVCVDGIEEHQLPPRRSFDVYDTIRCTSLGTEQLGNKAPLEVGTDSEYLHPGDDCSLSPSRFRSALKKGGAKTLPEGIGAFLGWASGG
ncbi:hypothetical protein CYMTET_54951 [Cymbomonas tetramitiformis]|uniref:DDHD domain-containing protein n=1 Tax=Cymbomonas tetramitiformis TaxID=36881 RepID=A0AAE0BFQ4_9CHLO|nr:hypothetical protein CYMTET_54951 [Cymbomonas tetramitiformis]